MCVALSFAIRPECRILPCSTLSVSHAWHVTCELYRLIPLRYGMSAALVLCDTLVVSHEVLPHSRSATFSAVIRAAYHCC